MLLTPDNAVCSQLLAQKLLSSSKMLPPTLKPFLLRLQKDTNVDFSRLMELSDHVLTFMSGQSHQLVKLSLGKSLGQKNLLAYESKFQDVGKVLIESLQGVEGPINLVKHIEEPLYLYVVKEIFGYKPKSEGALVTGVDRAVRFAEPMQSVRTLLEVQSIFDQLTREIAGQIGNVDSCGLIHDISERLISGNVDSYTKEQTATVITTLIIAARTTSETLSNILIENSRLSRVERERFSDEGWVTSSIDELIRFCASNVYLTRTAAQDLDVAGCHFAENDDILVHIPSSNRDSSYYDNCEYAKLGDHPSKRHLSFGAGIHRCPGAQLAVMTLSHALPALYRQFPELKVDINTLVYKSTKMATRLRSASATLY